MMDISRKDKGLNIALRGTLGIHLVCLRLVYQESCIIHMAISLRHEAQTQSVEW